MASRTRASSSDATKAVLSANRASAAPLLLVRSLLALEPDVARGRVELDPSSPRAQRGLRLVDMPLGETRVTIEVERDAVAVGGLLRGQSLIRPTV